MPTTGNENVITNLLKTPNISVSPQRNHSLTVEWQTGKKDGYPKEISKEVFTLVDDKVKK
jgi:hypothetical protein